MKKASALVVSMAIVAFTSSVSAQSTRCGDAAHKTYDSRVKVGKYKDTLPIDVEYELSAVESKDGDYTPSLKISAKLSSASSVVRKIVVSNFEANTNTKKWHLHKVDIPSRVDDKVEIRATGEIENRATWKVFGKSGWTHLPSVDLSGRVVISPVVDPGTSRVGFEFNYELKAKVIIFKLSDNSDSRTLWVPGIDKFGLGTNETIVGEYFNKPSDVSVRSQGDDIFIEVTLPGRRVMKKSLVCRLVKPLLFSEINKQVK